MNEKDVRHHLLGTAAVNLDELWLSMDNFFSCRDQQEYHRINQKPIQMTPKRLIDVLLQSVA